MEPALKRALTAAAHNLSSSVGLAAGRSPGSCLSLLCAFRLTQNLVKGP